MSKNNEDIIVPSTQEFVKESSIQSNDSGSTVLLPTVDENSVLELNNEEKVENDNVDFDMKEFEAAKGFYITLKGYNNYDVTHENYIYWKKTPGVGRYYREYVNNASLLMILVQLINERRELARLHEYEDDNSELYKKSSLFKYLDKSRKKAHNVYDKNVMTPEFVQFKTMCHLKRFGFIRNYLKEKFNVDGNEFRKYDDVKNYFINKNKN